MKVLIEYPYWTVITVNDHLTSERLDVCLREQFNNLQCYFTMTNDQYKVFKGSRATGEQLEYSDKDYIKCFSNWVDAVEGCGVTIEATKEFYELFDEALTDQ